MTWKTYLEEQQSRYQQELLQFLSIPSISALPAHAEAVQQAARWVADRLMAAGLENVQILPTGGHPVVYGEWLHAPGKPVVMIYGHFDMQPADPLDLWTSPPFEPEVRNGRVYARGASDDKGNMFIPILAVEALLRSEGALPVDVHGARTDLHSGLHGGAVVNPIHALVYLLDSMRSPEGKILVEGFYDAVVPLSSEDRAAIAAIPFDEKTYKETIGVYALVAEPGYTSGEHLAGRPTLEVNGIWGGFQGEGIKTVLPNEAHAKITCRLVANQDPATIINLITRHVERYTPPGVQVTVSPLPGTARPYMIPVDHWGNRAAGEVHKEMYGKAPYFRRIGGSLPVCELFLSLLGAYTVNFSFALPDEQQHAPNEFFRLSSFRHGQRAYGTLLHRLGKT
jgi:acetylornithine deacetylase/succinyl-diaminopimelate desuccinylase-like protein